MSAPPDTVLEVTPEEEAAIRAAVRNADPRSYGSLSRLATPDDAALMLAFLSDPRVSDPIYDLPRPFSLESVRRWIEESEAARERGECLLFINRETEDEIVGYSRITVWPDRSAAELAGAKAASRQNSHTATKPGSGGAGFGWIFERLGVRMMCLTAALDNVRSIRMIDAAGFRRMGTRNAVRPDGTIRPSVYWELTREEWRALHSAAAG